MVMLHDVGCRCCCCFCDGLCQAKTACVGAPDSLSLVLEVASCVPPCVVTDVDRVKQVLSIALSNAVKVCGCTVPVRVGSCGEAGYAGSHVMVIEPACCWPSRRHCFWCFAMSLWAEY